MVVGSTEQSVCRLLVALLLAGCSNFHVVEEGRFYRSGQPGGAQMAELIRDYKLRTVLRVGGDAPGTDGYRETRGPIVAARIPYPEVRLSARRYPTAAELLRVWQVLATAEYPMLVHCRSGADRSGLVSGLYVLQRSGDVEAAMDQLQFFPYLHTGLKGAWHLRHVFELYAPHADTLSFPDWVRQHYERIIAKNSRRVSELRRKQPVM